MLLLYLTIGGSGQALSRPTAGWPRPTARQRGRRGRPRAAAANLASSRLINVHMCIIYFFAGIAKLRGDSWWDGTAMWRAFANLEYQSSDMTWLAWHPGS